MEEKQKKKPPRIDICVCTKGRTDMLHQLLWSLIRQTYTEWDLIVVDDNDVPVDWKSVGVYPRLFNEIARLKHEIRFAPGPRANRIGYAYQTGLVASNPANPLFFRVDDDSWFEPDVLMKLKTHFKDPKLGACAGLFLHPGQEIEVWEPNDERYKHATIEELSDACNIQWYRHKRKKPIPVEHLTANILFSKEWLVKINGFETELYRQHRDETQATWRLHVAGAKLLVDPLVEIWHLKGVAGGARGHGADVYLNDHRMFMAQRRSMKHGVRIHLEHAIGDGIMATPAIRVMKQKYKDRDLAVWAPRGEAIFQDNPYVDAIAKDPTDEHRTTRYFGSIYGWASAHQFSEHMILAYCDMWQIERPAEALPELFLNGNFIPDRDSVLSWFKPGSYAVIAPYSLARTFDFYAPSRNKDWFEERWLEVVDHLKATGLQVVQLRGSDEEPHIQGTISITGRPLREVFHWIDRSAITVSIDTMAHHVASALRRPNVVLWGRSKPKHFGYFQPFVRNIEGDCPGQRVKRVVMENNQAVEKMMLQDRPCVDGNQWAMDQRVCPAGDRPCMKQVTVSQVCGAIDALLAQEEKENGGRN